MTGGTVLLTATSYAPVVGGAQALAHGTARELERAQRYRHRVVTQWSSHRTDWLLGSTVLAPYGQHRYELDGIPVQRLALSVRSRLRMLPHVLTYYARMSGAIERISDIMVEALAAAACESILVHNVRIGREGLSYASWKLARRLAVPFVFTPLHHPRWVGWRYRDYHELYRRADAVIALTEHERRTLCALGVDPSRIAVAGNAPHVAPYGDGDRFRERHQLGADPMVLFLGQKYRYKGVSVLLAAAAEIWRHHPRTRLVFVGPRTGFSDRVFAGVRDARVLDLPECELQEKSDALAAATVLAVPSSEESFGGVYLEAWAMGTPPIGGPAPAVAEVIADDVDGYVVPQDPAVLADRIGRLLADPDLRARMVERGTRKLREHFTWERIGAQFGAVYDQLLAGNGRGSRS